MAKIQPSTETRKAHTCYTCRFGRFDKRHHDRVARGQGLCTFVSGQAPWPHQWYPPRAFFNHVADGEFPVDSFEVYLATVAPIYYGHAIQLSHIEESQLRSEYAWLRWLAQVSQSVNLVSWFSVCDHYQEGNCRETA